MRTTPPYLGTRDCSSGTTVTISGYVAPYTDPTFKDYLEGIMNNSWYIPFICSSPQGELLYYEPYPVTPPNPPISYPVIVRASYNAVSVQVRNTVAEGGVNFAALNYGGGTRTTTNTACIAQLFPCGAFSGTFPGSSATFSVT
jgi:hypothetical protein